MITVNVDGIYLTCCYFSPNASYENYRQSLERMTEAAGPGTQRIILEDANAKSPRWGSPTWDARGEALVECLDSLDMNVLNDGKTPTWRRGSQKSYIDITAVTANIANKSGGWRVLDEESLSDHAFIMFEMEKTRIQPPRNKTRPLINNVLLSESIARGIESIGERRPIISELIEVLGRAQTEATVTRGGREVRLPYWWTSEIEEARKECIRRRRVATRNRGAIGEITNLHNRYRESRRRLAETIKKEKRKCWREVLDDLEYDVWGKGYKIVSRGIKSKDTPYELTQDQKKMIARQLFPEVEDTMMRREGEIGHMPTFTLKEIRNAALGLRNGKSPGPDGIIAETIKEAVRQAPQPKCMMDWLGKGSSQ